MEATAEVGFDGAGVEEADEAVEIEELFEGFENREGGLGLGGGVAFPKDERLPKNGTADFLVDVSGLAALPVLAGLESALFKRSLLPPLGDPDDLDPESSELNELFLAPELVDPEVDFGGAPLRTFTAGLFGGRRGFFLDS